MPDMERLGQIQMLTNLLSSMPPQEGLTTRILFPKKKAAQWATELVSVYGVRVHPELAAEEMLPDGVSVLGGQRRVDDVAMSAQDLLGLLRRFPNSPSLAQLAARVEVAMGDPLKETAMLDSIRRQYPDLMKSARVIADKAKPEDFE